MATLEISQSFCVLLLMNIQWKSCKWPSTDCVTSTLSLDAANFVIFSAGLWCSKSHIDLLDFSVFLFRPLCWRVGRLLKAGVLWGFLFCGDGVVWMLSGVHMVVVVADPLMALISQEGIKAQISPPPLLPPSVDSHTPMKSHPQLLFDFPRNLSVKCHSVDLLPPKHCLLTRFSHTAEISQLLIPAKTSTSLFASGFSHKRAPLKVLCRSLLRRLKTPTKAFLSYCLFICFYTWSSWRWYIKLMMTQFSMGLNNLMIAKSN